MVYSMHTDTKIIRKNSDLISITVVYVGRNMNLARIQFFGMIISSKEKPFFECCQIPFVGRWLNNS